MAAWKPVIKHLYVFFSKHSTVFVWLQEIMFYNAAKHIRALA